MTKIIRRLEIFKEEENKKYRMYIEVNEKPEKELLDFLQDKNFEIKSYTKRDDKGKIIKEGLTGELVLDSYDDGFIPLREEMEKIGFRIG